MRWDCDFCELQSDINTAEMSGRFIREKFISQILGDFFDSALLLLGHSATKLIVPLLLRDFFPFFAAFTAFSSGFIPKKGIKVTFFLIFSFPKGQN